MLESVDCALCGADALARVVETREVVCPAPGKEHDLFTVVRCRRCGLMFTNPRPTESAIGEYYEGYSLHRPPDPHAPVIREPHARQPRFLARALGLGNPGLPELPAGSRVLEIGCATGAFMEAISDRGYALTGLEPSPHAAAYARDVRRLDVICGTLETVPLPPGRFDMIYAWHVVEHFARPIPSLCAINALLKPGGVLCVSMPNAGAIERRLFRGHWAAWHLPVHYYHYTPRTIRAMLVKSGFEVTDLQQQRNVANVVQSIGALVNGVPGLTGLSEYMRQFGDGVRYEGRITALLKPLAIGLAALGHGGRMTVTARRPR